MQMLSQWHGHGEAGCSVWVVSDADNNEEEECRLELMWGVQHKQLQDDTLEQDLHEQQCEAQVDHHSHQDHDEGREVITPPPGDDEQDLQEYTLEMEADEDDIVLDKVVLLDVVETLDAVTDDNVVDDDGIDGENVCKSHNLDYEVAGSNQCNLHYCVHHMLVDIQADC